MPGLVEDANGTAQKSQKPTKNQLRRAKKKADKRSGSETPSRATSIAPSDTEVPEPVSNGTANGIKTETKEQDDVVEFELPEDDPLYSQFKDIFDRFQDSDKADPSTKELDKPEIFYEDDLDEIPEEDEDVAPKLSKKKRKEMNKLSVAELKAVARVPELVEWIDTSANDPRLLCSIKSSRNVVPVPSHWSLKREYLSSKRGVEKASFALPQFIKDTGISDMRDAVLEKQAEQSLKQKQRERVQPKMGKLDIDYQKLYEAFFRHQTKPELTRYGEVYYEGKELETNLRSMRPGTLSDALLEALGMPPSAPTPWLVNQQRFGPPPSYPALKIPGLNAPPPPGAQWGFHAGGYGKPPVDDSGKPLYGGDVFGNPEPVKEPEGAPVQKELWGELAPPAEESEDEEEEVEESGAGDEGDEDDDVGGTETPSGTFTPGGMASAVPTEIGGVESVNEFTLRKQKRGTETEESTAPRSAYQVLPEQNIRSQGFFGGERAYDLSKTQGNIPVLGQESSSRKRKVGDMDVSVSIDDLEKEDRLSKEQVARLHEENRKQQGTGQWKGSVDQDDLTQMIAEESSKRLKQDKDFQEKRRQGRR